MLVRPLFLVVNRETQILFFDLRSLACRCAKAARKRGFKVFGLQNYGECWSGPVDERTYNQTRRLNDCLMILGHPPPPCAMNDTRECMGGPGVNFNYGLGKTMNLFSLHVLFFQWSPRDGIVPWNSSAVAYVRINHATTKKSNTLVN